MGAMKYVPGDVRRKEMLYMGCSFENFSCKIEKNQKQIVTRFSDSELAVAAAPLRFRRRHSILPAG
ncbi:hypothetical protein LJR098_003127 [Rhizobium sp. LjRoot98]|uniref:hypothetical protein n=1 Tax=Rhizobium sp. LjRoot98 TaxID=3342345 RepID=UPI003ED07909